MGKKYEYKSDEDILKEYNEKSISASMTDMELDEMINQDMTNIWNEVGGQDGMYNNFPIGRFYRGKDGVPHRAYALDGYGGIAIFAYYSDHKSKICDEWKIAILGEDDGYHFLNSNDLYCSYYGKKPSFLSLLSEAISLINNNI